MKPLMKPLWTAISLVLALTIPAAGEESSANKKDEQAVRKVLAEWNEAWNKHDVSEPARFYAEDATFTSPGGTLTAGLKDITKENIGAHAGLLKKAQGQFQVERIQFLASGVAIVDGPFEITGMTAPNGQILSRAGRQTLVMEKKGGRWLIQAHRLAVPAPRAGQ